MAKKHTAGPWRAEAWRCHAVTTVLVDNDSMLTGKRVIAECEREEDARAIAVLPDALKVLSEFVERFGPIEHTLIFSKRQTLQRARALIAAAQGE